MTNEKHLAERSAKVTKSNELIQKSRFSLSLQQQKIMSYIISKVSPNDDEFKLYEFTIPEFCKVCGIDEHNGTTYADIKDAIKSICDKSIWVQTANGKETLLRWIEKPYIDAGSGNIQIRLDDDMRPYLLQIQNNFTSYELVWVLHFKSKYGIRLYEFIRSIQYKDLKPITWELTLDELRSRLGAEKYTVWQDLKRRALMPAIDDINNYSDRNISYEVLKTGKRILGIQLIISTKKPIERLQIRSKIEGDEQ